MKKNFHKNPLYLLIYADFEAYNEIFNSDRGNKTINIYKQNAVLNGYHIVSELEDVLKNGYHKSPLGYDNVHWFVNEDIKLENRMAFYLKNTKKDIIMTKKNEQGYRNINICRFCEEDIVSDKVRDHCHLTGKYRGPAHNTCNINVTRKRSIFIPFVFHNFIKYDCHLFFKKLVDMKNDKVKFDIKPKTNEEYISVTYGCIRFIDSYIFLSGSLDKLVKTLVDDSDKTLIDFKEEIVDNGELSIIVNEIVEENENFKDLKKEYPDKIEALEETLLIYMGENDLKNLKTEFPDN